MTALLSVPLLRRASDGGGGGRWVEPAPCGNKLLKSTLDIDGHRREIDVPQNTRYDSSVIEPFVADVKVILMNMFTTTVMRNA